MALDANCGIWSGGKVDPLIKELSNREEGWATLKQYERVKLTISCIRNEAVKMVATEFES